MKFSRKSKFLSIIVQIFILLAVCLPNWSIGSTSVSLSNKPFVTLDARKRILVPQANIGAGWRQIVDYNDSLWMFSEGLPGGVGYEKNSGYEDLLSLDLGNAMFMDGSNPNTCCYIRIPFTLSDIDIQNCHYLQLVIRYDDGFITFLNGRKVAEANAPQLPSWNSRATADHEATGTETINISDFIPNLIEGDNLLAIHGFNTSVQSSDFLISVELIASDQLFSDFTDSNLPIFLINSHGRSIPDEPKIDATMKVINNGPVEGNHPADEPTDYDGHIAVEIRGAYSSIFPQKPYGFETRDASGNNNNVSLLGMPEENDWALITNYNEKSLVRSTLAFGMARKMGQYAPRARLCEVFVNDLYQGIFLFCETIKRDRNRVDISKLRVDENSGDSLTGGYIIKIDYFNSADSWLSTHHPPGHPEQNVYFVYHYPEADEITTEQKAYIQAYIKTVQDALFGEQFADPALGYRNYLDVASFIDYFIVSEVSRNVDGYKKSHYFHKDKDSKDGLLYAGPIWDFDWAWKNFEQTDGSEWGYRVNDGNPDINPPGWYYRLLQDGYFTMRLIDRYFELRAGVLQRDKLYAHIDSVTASLGDAKERHFTRWPINARNIAPEIEGSPDSYEEEIVRLKNWIRLRLDWLDNNFPKLRDKIINDLAATQETQSPRMTLRVFPNPARDYLWVESNEPVQKISIYNMLGQQVYTSNKRAYSHRIPVSRIASGQYVIKVIGNNNQTTVTKHMIR